jgi:UDP-N-acetylglucosamine 2-epimerase (non-hydrolysing)
MPEEHNRIMIDHISDYLFCPTENTAANAEKDNVHGEIHVTGNTIVDAVQRNVPIARDSSTIHERLGIELNDYAVFTAHREENVDSEETLARMIETIQQCILETGLEIVFPAHPRTTKRADQFGLLDELESIDELHLTNPIGYLDFLALLDSADLALTDSGGIQEESCILGVPCVTLRENTERPETVSVGANVVAGTDPQSVVTEAVTQRSLNGNWQTPFGDGTAAAQIIDVITD